REEGRGSLRPVAKVEGLPQDGKAYPRAAHAMLSIISEPKGARVELDGRTIGKTPIIRAAPLKKGSFSVKIAAPNHKPWTGTLVPNATGHFSLKVVLAP